MAPSSTDNADAAALPTRIVQIGAGALGQALALRLAACGMPPARILSRTPAHAAALASRVGAAHGPARSPELPVDTDTVICCVPDDALTEVDRTLARARRDWAGVLVVHTSGAQPASRLAETAAAGAWTASLHPIQTFTRGSDASAFNGVAAGIEGAEPGLERARQLALRLGLRPFQVEAHMKGAYHLACALASNYLTTLLHLATKALQPLGIGPADAGQVLAPLIDRTLEGIRHTSPGTALTGPLVRGDLGTLDAHLTTIATYFPERYSLYLQLAEATRDLAAAAGRLSPDQEQALTTWLELRTATRPAPGDPGAASDRRSSGVSSSDHA